MIKLGEAVLKKMLVGRSSKKQLNSIFLCNQFLYSFVTSVTQMVMTSFNAEV